MSEKAQLPRGFDRKAYLRLAIPMIISRAGLAVMDIADGVMVAHFHAHEFAWLSLAEGTLGRLMDVFISFVLGGLALAPRHFSRGDTAGARAIWLRTFPVAIGLGLLTFGVSLFGKQILLLLGQTAEMSAGTAPCLMILSAGYPAAIMAIAAAVYLEGLNRPQFVAVSVAAANVLNVALNWLLISGHWGFPALGASGSALSTTLVRCFLCVALVGSAWRRNRNEPLEENETHLAEREASHRAQWRLGAGSAITALALATLTAPMTIIAGWLGMIPLAAFSAAWNITGLVYLIGLGMSDAAGIYVASEVAYGDLRAGEKVAWSAIRVTLVPLAVAATIILIWAFPVASLFTGDVALRSSLARVLPFTAVMVIVDTVGFVMMSALRALRESAWSTGIQIGAMALLVPLASVLALQRGFGVSGLFMAMLAAGSVRTVFLAWRFRIRTHAALAEPDAATENQWSLNAK